MKISKVFKVMAKIGETIVDAFESVVDFADHIIHRKKYARAKRRKTICTIILAVAGGIIAILVFPYRFIVKRNGDFEIRTLLFRVYRRTDDYAIPEGGSAEFEIAEVSEDIDAIEA